MSLRIAIPPVVTALAAMTILAGACEESETDHAAPQVVRVAVATNFSATADELARLFEQQSGHRVTMSSGSTGKLYAQIRSDAPFDVLLAADVERPRLLEAEGLAVAGSRYTYAVGALVLWSADPGLVDADGAVLASDRFQHLAIASPELAPYGAAAREVLQALGHWDRLQPRLVQGESIGQVFQFVHSGNAELGFVAAAQLGPEVGGSRWPVPPELHGTIEQQAVLLADRAAAREFLEFVRSPIARDLIRDHGYRVP